MAKHPKPQERALARELRSGDGLTVREIAERLRVSISSVSLWTRDIQLSDEQRAQNHAKGDLARRMGRSTKARIVRKAAQEEGRTRAKTGDMLHQAGCMLYWAEGAKDKNSLIFANSDVHMMRFWCRFLRTCMGVADDRIRMRLNVYTSNGRTLDDIEQYWLEALELPRSCMTQHTIDHYPTSSSGSKTNRLPYGVCTIRVTQATPLVQHVFGAIQEYAGFDEPRWLD